MIDKINKHFLRSQLNFRSIHDLNITIQKNLHRFHDKYDLIVGVPRSGMLPATILALKLNCELTDLNSFLNGSIYERGNSRRELLNKNSNVIKNVLILDDSLYSGNELERVRELIKVSRINVNVFYGVVYINPSKTQYVDLYLEIVNLPRVFEWNLFHSQIMLNTCMDIDGVLCEDPTETENDDGKAYLQFLCNAKPKFLPTVKVKCLVTNRLEKYRDETVKWLKLHRVEYEHLVMRNIECADERRRIGGYGEFKASVCKKMRADFFVESDSCQSRIIAEVASVDVFCTDNGMIYHPGIISELSHNTKNFPARILALIKRNLFSRGISVSWVTVVLNVFQV